MQQANKFGGLNHITLTKSIEDTDCSQQTSLDSPNNVTGEIVTAEELDLAKRIFFYNKPESISRVKPM